MCITPFQEACTFGVHDRRRNVSSLKFLCYPHYLYYSIFIQTWGKIFLGKIRFGLGEREQSWRVGLWQLQIENPSISGQKQHPLKHAGNILATPKPDRF